MGQTISSLAFRYSMRNGISITLAVMGRYLENAAGPFEKWHPTVDAWSGNVWDCCDNPYDPEDFRYLVQEGAFTEDELPSVSLAMWKACKVLESEVHEDTRRVIGAALATIVRNDVARNMDATWLEEAKDSFLLRVVRLVQAGHNADSILDWPDLWED